MLVSPRRAACPRWSGGRRARSIAWRWHAAWASSTIPRWRASSKSGRASNCGQSREIVHDTHRIHRRRHHGAAHGDQPRQEGLRRHRLRRQHGGLEGGGLRGDDGGGLRRGGGGRRRGRGDHVAVLAARGAGLRRRRRNHQRGPPGHALHRHVHRGSRRLAPRGRGGGGARGALRGRAGVWGDASGHRRHARHHGGSRRRGLPNCQARARCHGRQRDPRRSCGQRRGGQTLQQPHRRGGGRRGERGVSHRGGLRRRSQGGDRGDRQVLRQHLGDGEHAPRARSRDARRLHQRLRARLHDRSDVQGRRPRRGRRAEPPHSALRGARRPAGVSARLVARARPEGLHQRLHLPQALRRHGARVARMGWLRRLLVRLGTLGLALVVVIALVIVGFFASLPEIVRQVVVRQVPKAIGRQITIEDIDLNLFTGRLAIKKLRLSERTGSQAFVEFERLEVRMALLSLVHKDIHLRDFRLVGPVVRVVRGPDGKLNFDDLMPHVQERPLAREPTKWTFSLDHSAIEGGRVIVDDRAVTPAADWSIQDLALETSGVTTRPNAPPGWLKGSLRLGAAALEIKWDSFEQAPVRVAGTVRLTGFNLTRVRPYLPPTLASAFASGTLGIDLKVAYTRTEQGLQSARASGEAVVENAALVAPGTTDTLVGLTRLKVGLKQFDLEAREVALSLVELTGFDARLRRDKSGQIDLLAIFSKPADEAAAAKTEPPPAASAPSKVEPAPAPATPPTSPSAEAVPSPWKVRVEAVLGTDLAVEYVPTAAGESTVAANGSVTVSSVALDRPGSKETLVSLTSLGVGLKRFDLAGREVTLSRVELTGLDARIRRGKTGDLDIVTIAKGGGTAAAAPAKAAPPRPTPAPSPAPPQPAAKPWKITVEQTRIGGAKAAFVDETTNPAVQLNVTKLDVGVDNLTWPVRGPAAVTLAATLPGSGTLKVQGPVVLDPFDAQLAIAVRDAAIEPYQPYIPLPVRFTGRFNGDSKNRLAFKNGKTIIAPKGTNWAEHFEARMPDADHALIAIERMDLVDIDFDWPTKAIVAKAGFKRPAIEIERSEDGTLDIVKAFGGPAAPTVPNPKEPSASTLPSAAPAPAAAPSSTPPATPAPAASSTPSAAPAKPKG